MMNEFLIINFKITLLIGVWASFYKLFLSRNTFFELNRYYFLIGMFFSLVISSVSFDWYFNYGLAGSEKAIDHLSTNVQAYFVKTDRSLSFDLWTAFFIIWAIGAAFKFTKFCIQIRSLQKIRLGALSQKINGLKVYVTTQNITPFSFGKSIFLPQSCIDSQALDQILAHEKIHIKQWHSFDVIMAEMFCCFAWYNPLVFILRKSIKHNLEFLTDAQILDQGYDKKEYQYLLLGFSSAHSLHVTNSLNSNFLKNRIKMINQKRTNPFKRGVYLFSIPLILCLLSSFKFLPENRSNQVFGSETFSGDTLGIGDIDHIEIYGETGKGDTAYIHYKNGLVEKQFLKDRKENILFHQKYYSALPEHQLADKPKTTEYEPLNVIPEEISEFTMNDQFIWITLKNGNKEQYQLSDERQKSKFESKYGKLIVKRK